VPGDFCPRKKHIPAKVWNQLGVFAYPCVMQLGVDDTLPSRLVDLILQ
jgi:hypothetical protein